MPSTSTHPIRGILYFKKGWTHTSKGSCSSRVVDTDDANNIDVESVDIERDKPNNSDDTIVSKILEHTSEETLAEETNNLLAVRTKPTKKTRQMCQ